MKEELAAAVAVAPEEIRASCTHLVKSLLPHLGSRAEVDEVIALSTCRICTTLHFDSYFLLTTNAGYPTQQEGVALVALMSKPETFLTEARELMKRYGYNHLLTKLQAMQKDCADPAAIAAMMAAVWRLDEEDAAIAPVEGEWHNRDNTESFSLYFLRKLADAATRVAVARHALETSRSAHPLFMLTAHDLHRRKEHPHRTDSVFSEEVATDLQKMAANRVTEMRADDKLIYHPNLGQLLWLWSVFEGADTVKAWLKEQMNEDWRLATILTAFFGRSTGDRGVRYFISRKPLERWFTLDEALRTRLVAIDRAKLSRWQSYAVDEALRNIDQKAKGIGEVEYPD